MYVHRHGSYRASVLRVTSTLFLLLAGPRRPVQPERVTNGDYTPSHDYDLIHQRIEVSNFDWDSTAFDGRVTTTLVSLARRSIGRARHGRQLEVRSRQPPCARRPALPRPRLHPSRRLARRPARPAGGLRRHGAVHGGLPRRNRQGYGLYFFRGEAGAPTVPSRCTAAAAPTAIRAGSPPGAARRQGHVGDDRHVAGATHRRLQRPAGEHASGPARRAHHALAAGAAGVDVPDLPRRGAVREAQRPVARHPGGLLRLREDSARARPLFGVTPDMMEVYSRLTGVPYPWSKYAQVTVADFVGGMENVSATTLVDWLPDARAYRDRPWYRGSLIPHELAHQWFGDLVTAENWANYWLNEGMAEFMPGQYWGVKQGGARRAGLLPGGVPAVPRARRAPPDAARHLQLQQRLPEGRAGPRDAEGAARPRAVLGGDAPLSHPPRLRLGHERRPAAGGAGRHRPEPAVVLVPVDLFGGVSGLRGHGRLRLRRAGAHARRSADADRHRHRRQHRPPLRDPAGLSRAARRSGSAQPRGMSSAR